MTQTKQKQEERRTLDSVLAALDLEPDADPVEGETPDFTFLSKARTIGVEITMYHSGELVEGGLQVRRQAEAEWDALSATSAEFRNKRPDLQNVNAGLTFIGPVPPKRDHATFMEEVAAFIKQKEGKLGPDNIVCRPHTFTGPLMKKYLNTVYLRTDKHAVWHSNLVAGFIARPGPRIAAIVADKSEKAFRPADELWLAIQASYRISELILTTGGVEDFVDVPSLDSYKFSKVFVLAYNGAFEWSREVGWRQLTGKPSSEDNLSFGDLKDVLDDPEWLSDPDGKADSEARKTIAEMRATETTTSKTTTVKLEGRAFHGPGWHMRAVLGPDSEIQLYDIYIADKWIGSRRTEKQCRETLRNAGFIVV
jgi:hypothetical protein